MIRLSESLTPRESSIKVCELNMKKKIFIVDDYEESCLILAEILSEQYLTDYTFNSKDALEKIRLFKPDLILLDYQMPELNGLDLCKMIRAENPLQELPIVFLSGAVGMEEKLKAFEHGASDFVLKPYNVQELLLRLKVRLKENVKTETNLIAGNLKLDLITREVFVDNKKTELTVKQFEILKLLVESQGSIVTRIQFLSDVWEGVEVNSRNVDSQINYLKKKIQDFDGRIYSVPGQGYVLEKAGRMLTHGSEN